LNLKYNNLKILKLQLKNALSWTSTSSGLIPISIVGSCVGSCTATPQPTNPSPATQTNVECYTSDFGNKKGNLCFVGTFGVDAQIRGCAYQNTCRVIYKSLLQKIVLHWSQIFALSSLKYDSATKTGGCVQNCVTTGTVTCFSNDLGNKQGPVCYVGQFNGAKVVNCALGQSCAV